MLITTMAIFFKHEWLEITTYPKETLVNIMPLNITELVTVITGSSIYPPTTPAQYHDGYH